MRIASISLMFTLTLATALAHAMDLPIDGNAAEPTQASAPAAAKPVVKKSVAQAVPSISKLAIGKGFDPMVAAGSKLYYFDNSSTPSKLVLAGQIPDGTPITQLAVGPDFDPMVAAGSKLYYFDNSRTPTKLVLAGTVAP